MGGERHKTIAEMIITIDPKSCPKIRTLTLEIFSENTPNSGQISEHIGKL